MSIESEFEKVLKFIETENESLTSGAAGSIKKLEKVIAAFCAFMATQPKAEASKYKEKIEEIAAYLNKLSSHLNLESSKVLSQLGDLNSRQNAARAYTKRQQT